MLNSIIIKAEAQALHDRLRFRAGDAQLELVALAPEG
jgi:hypothetical protein